MFEQAILTLDRAPIREEGKKEWGELFYITQQVIPHDSFIFHLLFRALNVLRF